MADEKKTKPEPQAAPAAQYPDSPSGRALAKVGLDGDGEEYAKEKAKHRWGY